MKWRTQIESVALNAKIDYGTKIFTVGSCFAQNIAAKMAEAKFRVSLNPTGILFNPASIAQTLTSYLGQSTIDESRVIQRGETWVSLDCHSELSRASKTEAIDAYKNAISKGHATLNEASCIIITFGTAWVYEHIATETIVANCHKLPQSNFCRRRLSVDEIIELFRPLFSNKLKDKQIILTLSPVRHIGDGLTENSLSKATLRLAIDALCSEYSNVEYFPAYEIVTDDLRDYRFYSNDLVHPSSQAIEYIWEKFVASVCSEQAKQLMPKVAQIVAAAAHRPFNSQSEEYKNFCGKYLKEAKTLSEIDFSRECAIFEQLSHKS